MNNFIKRALKYFPTLYTLLQSLYYAYINNDKIFTVFKLSEARNLDVKQMKFYNFTYNNFEKLKKKNKECFFFISNKKILNNYSNEKFKQMLKILIKKKSDIVYDGNCPHYTEIVSKKTLNNFANYSNDKITKNFIQKFKSYPYKFFYFAKEYNLKVSNIGLKHRSYNFNGSFFLPGLGKSIGDQGDVTFRLKYIPNLNGKTFLDIGSEEGYAVFDAISKGAKYAKGLNIRESDEYDFFPNYNRPAILTARKRNEIKKTINFLIKHYNLSKSKKIKFEYKNIYDLGKEKFDFVFCFGVLYHLKNPYAAIENLFKITNETLLLETQGIGNNGYLNCQLQENDGFVRYSPKALTFLLKKAGFKKVNILLSNTNKSKKITSLIIKANKL